MIKDLNAIIVENLKISKDFYRLTLKISEKIECIAGQFVSLKSIKPSDTLLRRPFAISNYKEDGSNYYLELIFQTRGKTTNFLKTLVLNDKVNILVPCGNGFTLENKKAIVIAGGIGLGPMLFLEKKLKENNIDITFIAGFRDKSFIPDSNIFPLKTVITTDDGSYGFKGTTLDYLKTLDLTDSVIYCCGPTIMMKYIALFAQEKDIKCFVSLEEMMGCSLGACMGCVVELTNGKKARVCKEGPVFDSEAIKWN